MKFEDKPITFETKPLYQDSHTMDKLRDKREGYFKEHRPEIDDFPEYSEAERERNKREIQIFKELWESDTEYEKFQKDISSIFEGAIFDLIEINNFLGEGCKIVPASEWDDIKNGIDGVMIFEDENQNDCFSGIEVDVTFSSAELAVNKEAGTIKKESGGVDKKIDSIKQCIKEGILPTLKYFKNPKTGEHQVISLPKVIIGIQQSSAEGLIRLWGNSDGKNEKLKNHPVQSKIIMELLVQLKYFFDFAKGLLDNTKDEEKKNQYKEICQKYGQTYNRIYDVYISKKDLIDSHMNEISSDEVYNKILEKTEAIEKN